MRLPTATSAEARLSPALAPLRYFRRLWSGDLPLSQVFWRDMLVIGTLVNIATFLAAIFLIVGHAPTAYAVVAYLIHIPYNIVVFAGVWRSAARERSEWGLAAQTIALTWLAMGFFI